MYALGALLYVVLTGQHPTAPGERPTPLERMRAVIDTNPARPSDAALGRPAIEGVSSEAEALNRRAAENLRVSARALRGDLDNIVLKALKKTPAERYRTVEAFAEDLCHYLDGEPVSARADSLSYRTMKFVTRHKLIVGAAGIVFATVIAAAIVSFWQAREATRQRDRALSLATRNEAVVDFVAACSPRSRLPTSRCAWQICWIAVSKILMSGASDPEHQAAILSLLASSYLATGNAQQADVLLTRSLTLTKSSADTALRAVLLCESALCRISPRTSRRVPGSMDQGLRLSTTDAMREHTLPARPRLHRPECQRPGHRARIHAAGAGAVA